MSPSRDKVLSGEGGSNRCELKVGKGERIPLADEVVAGLEGRRFRLEVPCIDPSREGEDERILSGGRLVSFSGSMEDSLDMPDKRTLLVIEVVSDTSSSWFLGYPVDPSPLSSVCLNQVGSLDARDCAI